MKNWIKKILRYEKWYHLFKNSFFYVLFKKTQARIAAMLSNYPAKDFFIIGVTGTNGKTTTVSLIHKMLNDLVSPSIAISTADIKIWDKVLNNTKKMTALDVFDLQSNLLWAKEVGCKIAILEVSSHGIDQHRFEGIDFDLGVLTNITHDHLDYHKNMENYAETKKKLFKSILSNKKQNKFWIFPADDPIGRKWFEELPFDKKINYGVQASAILKATSIIEYLDHTEFSFSYLGQVYHSKTRLLGAYNIRNILAAIALGVQIGLDIDAILQSLEKFKGVDGRLQYHQDWGVHYFVDFAHTPDAIEQTLSFLQRKKRTGKLIAVFGVPGNRDKSKRPIMGSLAQKYADILICTDDDPDSENRLTILDQLSKDIQEKYHEADKASFIIPERYYAIKLATDIAQEGDIVVMMGKGHETVQLTNYGKRSWNDMQKLKEILKQ